MKIFVLIFSSLISFISFWYGLKLFRLYLRVSRWDKITATVIKKAIVKKTLSAASRAPYKLSVEYSYLYNLQKHKGNKVFLIELLGGEKGFLYNAAKKILEKINPETEIYVNPNSPEESVVFCDGIILYLFVLLLSPLSLLVGLGTYFT